ncbi:MAG: LysM peptidoglycan-binding domain-containing protein [Deltaproteobacteria bacterium]|jgi:hypothetical protein|nr:LysM peptidoglycan-binding domain-containing protein [Deltaproteobacteria bacterium]
MKKVNRHGYRLPVALLALALSLGVYQSGFAQDFEDTIESELDSLSGTGSGESDLGEESPINTKPTPKPAGKNAQKPLLNADDFVNEEPLLDEAAIGGLEDETILPLETSSEPPAKSNTRREETEEPLNPFGDEEVKAPKAPKAAAPVKKPEPEITASIAPGSDEPNSAFESRLAEIFNQHGSPVSDEKWSELIGTRATESYSVQPGDTLWDLSQTLFADGFYWSRLWAENPEIQNPHNIAKGQAIRFIGGTEATPPEIRVVKDEPDQLTEQSNAAFDREDVVPVVQELPSQDLKDIDISLPASGRRTEVKALINEAPVYQEDMEGKITQADLEAGVVIEQGELIPRPTIPAPDGDKRQVLRKIPSSFKELRPRAANRTVTIQRRNSDAEKNPPAVVPGYMAFEQEQEPMGEVVEVDTGEYVASIGQIVMIEANEPMTVGSRVYSVISKFKITSPENGRVGYAYEVGGIIKLIDLADEKRQIYRGQIVYAVNPVRLGADILLGQPPRVAASTKGRRTSGELIIVGGEEAEDRKFFGDGSIVFLDVNKTDVRVGDVLSVQSKRGERKKTVLPDFLTPVGILKVFQVSGTVASAFVVVATDEVRVGDRTGPIFPTRLPDLVLEAPRVSTAPAE